MVPTGGIDATISDAPEQRRSYAQVVHFDALVVGAGQAGLAAGHYLSRAGATFLVLDADRRVGDVWRRRWPFLKLITPVCRNGLPGLPFPGAPDDLPSRDRVADYLEHYARHFQLPVRNGVLVERLSPDLHGYRIATSDGDFTSRVVIVATGAFRALKIPEWASRLDPSISQLTAPEYAGPEALPPGDVCVIGAGNSGAQVALDIGPARRVYLAGPHPGTLPRTVLGRDVYHWIWPALRLRTTWGIGRIIATRRHRPGHPLVGLRPADLERDGLVRVGRVRGACDGRPQLDDGRVLDVGTVIWATGYRPHYPWIDLPIFDAGGAPRHEGGLVPEASGLAFLGLPYQRRLNSGLVGGVGSDAREIVDLLLGT
jgi:putative flavoprotein involved in K+ transport